MTYILKQFYTPLVKFSATEDSSTPEISILWVNEENRSLLPLDLELTPEGMSSWLRHRVIPKNRAYIHTILAKCGLNANRPVSIINACLGLSLNDSYWVVKDGFDGNYAQCNLYEQKFSNFLSQIALTGEGNPPKLPLSPSPEFTTNGMLPKCWRRVDGKIMLYKGGTSGASNTGFEPYSEFYAAQIAETMGINAISYGLSRWKDTLCSTCELFTSKERSFIPVGRIVKKGGFKAVEDYYSELDAEYQRAFGDMLLFDAVICNTDRHLGNFGFLINNATNEIVAPAPLFDHGNSLFNLAGTDCWTSADALQEYADTLLPNVYDDFFGTAKAHMNSESKEKVQKLLEFRFKRHSRYNLHPKRLKMIEDQIHKRARTLLCNKYDD
ncbi:MAG: XRE family transcriptional regulator [Ruminococcaceae bacterium]|nr:XRE family transcriptional regulator [Oscillospiraceae bacterium]